MATLKLYPELARVTELIRARAFFFQQYGARLRACGGYQRYEVRFANDVLRAVTTIEERCGWYETYGCNDKHITALAIEACRRAGVL